MEVGIVGKKGVGKTTLFNALTGMGVDGFTEKVHLGVADIPDPRLGLISSFIPAKKLVPATIRMMDIPGVPAGSDAKKLSTFLEQIRQVDATLHVVRCFDDGSGTIDPLGDLESMETDLALADLVVADGALSRAQRTARSGDKDARARVAVLERVCAELENGTSIRAMGEWSEEERRILSSYGFVTSKPVLYVANVDEGDLDGASGHAAKIEAYAAEHGSTCVPLCAKLEAEIAELDEADRTEMLESLGVEEPAIGPVARAANHVLGLTTFYTAGEKEVRAWPIVIGASAPQAAGVIHSDLERGFIRAECYSIADLEQHQSEKAIRDAGKLRSEGKNYTMQDGDIVNFLFNV